jgi:hypothetical protein
MVCKEPMDVSGTCCCPGWGFQFPFTATLCKSASILFVTGSLNNP